MRKKKKLEKNPLKCEKDTIEWTFSTMAISLIQPPPCCCTLTDCANFAKHNEEPLFSFLVNLNNSLLFPFPPFFSLIDQSRCFFNKAQPIVLLTTIVGNYRDLLSTNLQLSFQGGFSSLLIRTRNPRLFLLRVV